VPDSTVGVCCSISPKAARSTLPSVVTTPAEAMPWTKWRRLIEMLGLSELQELSASRQGAIADLGGVEKDKTIRLFKGNKPPANLPPAISDMKITVVPWNHAQLSAAIDKESK
jgi:hypothetical protein